ncbi:hypothetical protein K9N50_01830 [bacterium]|nr:hypothetical protein [bacterium]
MKIVDMPELLQIREQVEFRVSSGDDVSIFLVRVEDITTEGIFIDRPIMDRGVFNVEPGERIGIEYRRGMVKYRFSSLIISEGRLGSMPVIQIEHPKHIDRIRHKLRRKWLRLNIPTKLVFSQKNTSEKAKTENKHGIIKDVSGGGLKFIASKSDVAGIYPGTVITLTFNLSGEVSVIEQEAKVIKMEPASFDIQQIETVVIYSNISSQLSEAIIIHNVKHQNRYTFGKRKL